MNFPFSFCFLLISLRDSIEFTNICDATEGEGFMKISRALLLGFASIGVTAVAIATETLTYTYDAKGRLTKVVRTGTVNNNVTVEYEHDKADNRTRVKTTNSSNPPP